MNKINKNKSEEELMKRGKVEVLQFAMVLLLSLAVFCIAKITFYLTDLHGIENASHWLITEGSLVSVKRVVVGSRSLHTCVVAKYKYVVGNKEYYGDRIQIGESCPDDIPNFETMVKVHFNPVDPHESVLIVDEFSVSGILFKIKIYLILLFLSIFMLLYSRKKYY